MFGPRVIIALGLVLGLVQLAHGDGNVAMEPDGEKAGGTGEPGTPADPPPLIGTFWTLVSLGGEPVEAPPSRGSPHLILSASHATLEGQVSGFGGCNRIAGSYRLRGRDLVIGPLAATRMACLDDGGLEAAFLDAIAKTERYRIRDRRLELLGAKGRVLASFEDLGRR